MRFVQPGLVKTIDLIDVHPPCQDLSGWIAKKEGHVAGLIAYGYPEMVVKPVGATLLATACGTGALGIPCKA